MLRFYYDPAYKYTNRKIINVTGNSNYTDHDYENIDSPDTINGHIIYTLSSGESIPTYIVDLANSWRWFVSGITQLRTGKYQISLLRDIISESPSTWGYEEAYITAGNATNYNKYKRWNLPYTNTKIRQERFNINGKSSFFVFYVNEQHINSDVISESPLVIKYSNVPGISNYDYIVNGLNSIPSYSLVGSGPLNYWNTNKSAIFTTMYNNYTTSTAFRTFFGLEYDSQNGITATQISTGANTINLPNTININTRYVDINNNVNNCKTDLTTAFNNYISAKQATYGTSINSTQISNLAPYINKIIYDSSTNKVYSIRLSTSTITHDVNDSSATFATAIRNINFPPTTDQELELNQGARGNWILFNSQRTIYTYTLEELASATTFDFTFTSDVRKLPKSAVRCVNIVSDSNFTDEELTQCLMLAQTNGINPDNTTGRILDIQYLPFSIATTTNSDLKINNTALTAEFLETDDFQYITDLTDLTNINKETDTIKIVSPSRASQFLFRPYDNNGNMLFNSKITIKPYTSTIYIRPSTLGLLVNDWDDKDCLIIQEDFSLTNVTSEWTQYVYNNRTYLNAFERQMQGREYERSWERQVEQAQAKSDEWNARNISAQKAQTYTGNIPIISNIAGAIGTAWVDQNYMEAAQMDRAYNEALYQEGMSLSRDLFNYQLENIKSQPQIPSKVTTIDCKFLDGVYLEYYSTNETELNAIAKFYEYNGNRIDDYGSFADYWGNFVKGKIIISIHYTQPEIDELNRRLSMGIFTGGTTI